MKVIFMVLMSFSLSAVVKSQIANDIYMLVGYNVSVVENRLENTLKCERGGGEVSDNVRSIVYTCGSKESFIINEGNGVVEKIIYLNGDSEERVRYLNYLIDNGFVMVELPDIGLSNYNKKTIVGQLINSSNTIALITGNESPVVSFVFYKGDFD